MSNKHAQEKSNKIPVFILPCAGEGHRLGLKTPKELYEIMPGIRLIDFSLAHIRESTRALGSELKIPRVVLTVIRGKEDVVDYVKSQLKDFKINTVHFNQKYSEWPGSVHSAQKFYGDLNIVLLPDSRMSMSHHRLTGSDTGKTLIDCVAEGLERNHVVMGIQKCEDKETLRSLGAVHVDQNGYIRRFQDKPAANLNAFNGFWCCYAFRKDIGEDLYRFLIRSVKHEFVDFCRQSFYPPISFQVADYVDLGTWDSIEMFRQSPPKVLL